MYHICKIFEFVIQCAHRCPSRQSQFVTLFNYFVHNAPMGARLNFSPNRDSLYVCCGRFNGTFVESINQVCSSLTISINECRALVKG